MQRAAIRIHVLPQQRDFFHALVRKRRHFGQHIVERARHFLAAGIGHDTEAAILTAPFHDRDKGSYAFYPRRRQVIEFFDLGERNIHLRTTGFLPRLEHFRQPVQGLRAEYEIDVGCAPHDGRAFLAGDATADTDP